MKINQITDQDGFKTVACKFKNKSTAAPENLLQKVRSYESHGFL